MEKKKQTFEEALARLDEIVRQMETGSARLDESLALFEEGVGLVKFCTGELDRAEQNVKIVQQGEHGEPTEKPFAKPE
ncbi:MAG: exodeoxyribonuclease VII small subunit [Ruminococcus sp.]|nr:exodeoxyribonuclease VII small subunit [Candidatus Apopatosoma intestinale]